MEKREKIEPAVDTKPLPTDVSIGKKVKWKQPK